METALVTGAFGLVGSALVRHLVAEGRAVVATDLDTPANRRKAAALASGSSVEVRWADLTDAGSVDDLVRAVDPAAIVHLAAIIPPLCYAQRALARRVNVGATVSLVAAASASSRSVRFVLASSVAVYGPRNPHRTQDLLSAATPVSPGELYGAHKVEAERAVTSSSLDWVVLRLGGVLSPAPSLEGGPGLLYFENALPIDGRLQTVDVRDVAAAFAAATTTEATREVFLVGGDESHRLAQGQVGPALASAMGLVGGLPPGRPGDPDSDTDWFATDFMDTARAQEVLAFQHHSLPALLEEVRRGASWRRGPLRVAAPVVRGLLARRAPYRNQPGSYADPWGAVRRKWGDPSPDGA